MIDDLGQSEDQAPCITCPSYLPRPLDETLRALDDLAPRHRKEFSYARTAKRLKIPVGTVRSRLSRARAELLVAVGGNGRGPRERARCGM